MRPLDLAMKYMEIFFSGDDLDELGPLFAPEFTFRGPFFSFDSGKEYIRSLKKDPPKDFDYTIIRSFEDESSACLVYQFSKPGVSVPMAQLFECRNGKISSILLIFDTRAFSEAKPKTQTTNTK